MNSVFVTVYHFDDNSSLTLCVCVCVRARDCLQHIISHHLLNQQQTSTSASVHLCGIKITPLARFTPAYPCKWL